MKMKYFRFLYGETAGCFTHFGELNDTLTKEHITFLYLSGVRGCESDTESEHALFLYPEYLDLVVLSGMNERTTEVLKEILTKTRIRKLVVPEVVKTGMDGALNSGEVLKDCLGESLTSVEHVVSLDAEKCSSFESKMCGWKFFVKHNGANELVLIHAMAESGFEDVVMNVKQMHEQRACRKSCSPDEFGCAFGCTLHRDYQECKYRRTDVNGILCRTGSLLMSSGTGRDQKVSLPFGENSGMSLMETLFVESGIGRDAIRFSGCSGDAWNEMCSESVFMENASAEEADSKIFTERKDTVFIGKECKSETEYFIGSDSEVEDDAIAKVCRSGLNRIPVLLKEGQGVCCSGFFKYKEIN